jgi:AcrR family transcriptional regulator
MAVSTGNVKPLRSDARRNRERIVASARTLFAKAGTDVSVEDITRHAGVGMGTLYRHFATKEELLDAVLEETFEEIVGLANAALVTTDAWAGFSGFLEGSLALHAENRGLKDVLGTRQHGLERARAMRARLRPLLRRLIERAQAQGTLRADFAFADLPLVFWTTGRVIELTAGVAPDFWRRHLALMLDGLRVEAARPLPQPPLTEAELERVAPGRKR